MTTEYCPSSKNEVVASTSQALSVAIGIKMENRSFCQKIHKLKGWSKWRPKVVLGYFVMAMKS